MLKHKYHFKKDKSHFGPVRKIFEKQLYIKLNVIDDDLAQELIQFEYRDFATIGYDFPIRLQMIVTLKKLLDEYRNKNTSDGSNCNNNV